MPTNKKWKRAVRARMDKTGESYTSARAALAPPETPAATIPFEEITPERSAELRERVRAAFQLDGDERAQVERACVRLAAALPARAAILCRDALGEALAVHGEPTLRERLRAGSPEEDAASAVPRLPPIELITSLEWQADLLLCRRRVDGPMKHVPVSSLSQRLAIGPSLLAADLRTVRLSPPWNVVQLLRNQRYVLLEVAFHAREVPLPLLQLHVGHAALAIERALAP